MKKDVKKCKHPSAVFVGKNKPYSCSLCGVKVNNINGKWVLALSLALLLTGCHVHHYGMWTIINHERSGMIWDQCRTCTNCGYTEVHIESAVKGK